MKICYIAHPISGNVQGNMEKIYSIVRTINLLFDDVVPFAPYMVDLISLNDSVLEERKRGIRNNLEFFNRKIIDELWVFGDWRNSKGVNDEILIANKLSIPIKYFTYKLTEPS